MVEMVHQVIPTYLLEGVVGQRHDHIEKFEVLEMGCGRDPLCLLVP